MHDGFGNAGRERFQKFGLQIKPWRKDGRHIVITTQSALFYEARLGTTRDAWISQVINELHRHTDRDVVICVKPDASISGNAPAAESFEADLNDAWAMVTYSSSTAVKAVLEGVPVFSLAASMVSCLGLDDLGRIEEPVYPDEREQVLWNLAANQWTLKEMRDGTCWRGLQNEPAGEPPVLDAKVEVETESVTDEQMEAIEEAVDQDQFADAETVDGPGW